MKEIKLMEDSIGQEERDAVTRCMKSGEYTQGKVVDEFENEFAKWNGSKYAIMVNSGSSANLIMVQALKEKYSLREGDEVLVPMVTWPTNIYPVIQNNLVPVFCDVDGSFNINYDSIVKMVSKKTKAIFVTHLLGQPAKIEGIKKFCELRGILLIEDCCESTGAEVDGIKVGNFGVMGSTSFYFGHLATTIEGGMITTNDYELYDLLKSLRSHGWVKGTEREDNYPELKNGSFVFDTMGYNLRSTNINAAIGLVQLNRIDGFIEKRKRNHEYFLERIKDLNVSIQEVDINETCSFCFGIIFEDSRIRNYILEELPKRGIECRPIVTGNILKQPVFARMDFKKDYQTMADIIHNQGIYLPNNQFIGEAEIDYMVDTIKELLNENKISNRC